MSSPTLSADASLADYSEQFLREVRQGEFRGPARQQLERVPWSRLAALDQHGRLAFWINVYNATVQAALGERPDRFDSRRTFFSNPLVTVANTELSLDDIEHGILRRSQWKYGLGYMPQPFPSAFEREHRLPERDGRIHFALNCGAASCPPISAYRADAVDEQLDVATERYLTGETVVEDGTVYLPRLLLWYRGDFGGRASITRLLDEHGVVDPSQGWRFRYRSYDWSLDLDRFSE